LERAFIDRLLFSQTWVECAATEIRLFLIGQVDEQSERIRQYLLAVTVSLSKGKADNRTFNLRVIGSASMRLAL
jgi:hypothetical protein